MGRWKRVKLTPETVAGQGTRHSREDLGEIPLELTDYARANGAVAHRDGEDVAVYVSRDGKGSEKS